MTQNLSYKNFIVKIGREKVKLNEPMSMHTTIGIGGPADLFYSAKSEEELVNAVKMAHQEKIPVFVLGGGSNILVSDKGIRGLVVSNETSAIKFLDNRVIVDSGVRTQRLVKLAIENKLAGLEYFNGLPGTIGGAIWNNSHFKGHYVADILENAEVIDKNSQVKILTKNRLEFAYDNSILQKSGEIVLRVNFTLKPGSKQELEQIASEVLEFRKKRHPLDKKSDGCFFKNPSQAPAAYLIEQSGLKGEQIGDAQVSTKHAAFIINKYNAKADDVLKLIELIKEKIKKDCNIKLETEVNLVGEF